jgi:hypothetical protein
MPGKHSIKRIDRLLSNRHLHDERAMLYATIATHVVGGTQRPLVIVDWSGVGNDARFWLLRAAIAFNGRALPVYEEVHPLKRYDNRAVRKAFLQKLRTVLGEHVRPIVVTDGGFRSTWFNDVSALGWDWVGRVRGRTKADLGDGEWIPVKTLQDMALATPRLLPNTTLTQSAPITTTLVLWRGRSKGRQKKKRRDGKKSQWWRSKYYERYSSEPWVLATSLTGVSAQRIVRIYKTRMGIEESLRELKCPRFGWGLDYSRTRDAHRLEILVLIGALASLCAWLYGVAASRLGLSRKLQANTERRRTVLSRHLVGAWIFRQRADWLATVEAHQPTAHTLAITVSAAHTLQLRGDP